MTATAELEQVQQFRETAITVASGTAAAIQEIIVPNAAGTCCITVKNSHATVAFDAFSVEVRSTLSAPYIVHANVAGDFDVPVLPMVYASGSPVTLAAGASVQFRYDVSGLDAIRLKASGNAATSTAEVYYHFGV